MLRGGVLLGGSLGICLSGACAGYYLADGSPYFDGFALLGHNLQSAGCLSGKFKRGLIRLQLCYLLFHILAIAVFLFHLGYGHLGDGLAHGSLFNF